MVAKLWLCIAAGQGNASAVWLLDGQGGLAVGTPDALVETRPADGSRTIHGVSAVPVDARVAFVYPDR